MKKKISHEEAFNEFYVSFELGRQEGVVYCRHKLAR